MLNQRHRLFSGPSACPPIVVFICGNLFITVSLRLALGATPPSLLLMSGKPSLSLGNPSASWLLDFLAVHSNLGHIHMSHSSGASLFHAAPEPRAWEAVSGKDLIWYLGQGPLGETEVPGEEVASASGLFH